MSKRKASKNSKITSFFKPITSSPPAVILTPTKPWIHGLQLTPEISNSKRGNSNDLKVLEKFKLNGSRTPSIDNDVEFETIRPSPLKSKIGSKTSVSETQSEFKNESFIDLDGSDLLDSTREYQSSPLKSKNFSLSNTCEPRSFEILPINQLKTTQLIIKDNGTCDNVQTDLTIPSIIIPLVSDPKKCTIIQDRSDSSDDDDFMNDLKDMTKKVRLRRNKASKEPNNQTKLNTLLRLEMYDLNKTIVAADKCRRNLDRYNAIDRQVCLDDEQSLEDLIDDPDIVLDPSNTKDDDYENWDVQRYYLQPIIPLNEPERYKTFYAFEDWKNSCARLQHVYCSIKDKYQDLLQSGMMSFWIKNGWIPPKKFFIVIFDIAIATPHHPDITNELLEILHLSDITDQWDDVKLILESYGIHSKQTSLRDLISEKIPSDNGSFNEAILGNQISYIKTVLILMPAIILKLKLNDEIAVGILMIMSGLAIGCRNTILTQKIFTNLSLLIDQISCSLDWLEIGNQWIKKLILFWGDLIHSKPIFTFLNDCRLGNALLFQWSQSFSCSLLLHWDTKHHKHDDIKFVKNLDYGRLLSIVLGHRLFKVHDGVYDDSIKALSLLRQCTTPTSIISNRPAFRQISKHMTQWGMKIDDKFGFFVDRTIVFGIY